MSNLNPINPYHVINELRSRIALLEAENDDLRVENADLKEQLTISEQELVRNE